jgi:hypothetical protein
MNQSTNYQNFSPRALQATMAFLIVIAAIHIALILTGWQGSEQADCC